ncbi:MAG: metallophosphatase family protein [Chitinophagales bacterium]|nr:metallophosphatase family protein [Chitinophagales bacterium]
MKRIAVISDNHGYFGDEVSRNLQDVDEIWHAGDIGNLASIEKIRSLATFRGVYGNIDDLVVRDIFPLNQLFVCEGLKVFMTHIGGYPGKYTARVKQIIGDEKPNIYVCGHSHICKVVPDHIHQLLHINPGAYGIHGFHQFRTMIRFEIEGQKIQNMRVIELGLRGSLKD